MDTSDSQRTPLTASSQFIQADDDDDYDEENMPGFTNPVLASPVADKGKTRAHEPEQLAPPSSSGPSGLSGNIGSSSNTAPQATRSTVGGVRVETR